MRVLRRFGSFVLLAFTPLALALDLLVPNQHNLIFLVSILAIMPLAGYIGAATEQLAGRLGGGIGGLLNATFGNAAELIIGTIALQKGLPGLVKASITGSIIGNVLLVFGAAALVGGLRFNVQRFNRTAAGLGTTAHGLAASHGYPGQVHGDRHGDGNQQLNDPQQTGPEGAVVLGTFLFGRHVRDEFRFPQS